MGTNACWADMAQAEHAKELDDESRLAARCWYEIGENTSSEEWWGDTLRDVPDDIWNQFINLMASDDPAEAANVLMNWGKDLAKRQVQTKYHVILIC